LGGGQGGRGGRRRMGVDITSFGDCRMILIIKEPRFVTDDPYYVFTHTYLLDTVRKDEKNQSVSVYL
jgi:hypothetical protein